MMRIPFRKGFDVRATAAIKIGREEVRILYLYLS